MKNTSSFKIGGYNDYQNINNVSASNSKKFHYANNTSQTNKYEYGMFSRRYVPGNTSKTNISAYGANLLNKSSRMMSHNNSSMNVAGGLLNT